MGILQSVLKYWSSEEESPICSYNNGDNQNAAVSILSRDLKYLTISVLNIHIRDSSANNKLKSSTVFISQNENRTGKQRVDNAVNAEGIRWMKHYSSSHRILLVGDGDFSFSTCLAAAFGWASNMIATSLDSQDFLVKNYQNALSNLVELSIRKCKVMHEIDATKMCNHPFLGGIKFDRIVFNFPFAGFFKDISRDSQLRRHRKLVSQFLMNAKEMISENGEIHITHKTNGFHMEWKVESMASSHGLRLVEAVDFNLLDYPGYNTKYGFGGIKFDCVVFNFPFAGLFKHISRDSQLQRHRKLVSQFLMNAKKMISETGEIHITHKTSEFQMEWKVESMASSHGLRLVEAVDFNLLDYPGYNTKYGFGGDKNFNCYPSKTYKFGLRF